MDLLKIKPWGPKPLRKILEQLQNAINERTPKEGFGTRIKEHKDGVQIHAEVGASGGAEALAEPEGVPSSGTPRDVYGAFNGEPAVFHLLESSPPDPVP